MLREEVYRLAARRHELYGRLLPEQSASLRTYHEQELARLYRAFGLVRNFDYYVVDTIRQTAVFLVFALELESGVVIAFAGRGAYPEVAFLGATLIWRILREIDVIGVEFAFAVRSVLIIVDAGLFEVNEVVIPKHRRIAVRRLEPRENRTGVVYLDYYVAAVFVSLGSMRRDFA